MNAGEKTSPLLTDLYELTMAASYFGNRVSADATFSLFIRGYPPNRNYFVAAGLEEALAWLEAFHFAPDDLQYLSTTGLFEADFLKFLSELRFSGEVLAMPEGTIFFANEPVLEVTAPILQAQLLETYLLNTVGFQTLIATKAARCLQAAAGRGLVDFSLRRTQGADAGLRVARSTYLAGFSATSNVLAGRLYGIPISGTMAHSFVSAFPSEKAAFEAFARTYPDNSVFLIDTYDTLEGARQAAIVGRAMRQRGGRLRGVRLDSGDMADLSRRVRRILDAAGLQETQIFASSGFDEFKIADVIGQGAPIDAFGVGTKIGVSADAPYFDIVYKMACFEGRPVRKLSPGKVTLAGAKQVFRRLGEDGRFADDLIGVRDEPADERVALLEPVMGDGRCLRPRCSLQEIRSRFHDQFERLPAGCKSLREAVRYPVHLSPRLQALQTLPLPR